MQAFENVLQEAQFAIAEHGTHEVGEARQYELWHEIQFELELQVAQ